MFSSHSRRTMCTLTNRISCVSSAVLNTRGHSETGLCGVKAHFFRKNIQALREPTRGRVLCVVDYKLSHDGKSLFPVDYGVNRKPFFSTWGRHVIQTHLEARLQPHNGILRFVFTIHETIVTLLPLLSQRSKCVFLTA